MPCAPTESGAVTVSLRQLAAREADVAAPYDFAEFQRRAVAHRPVASGGGVERTLRIAAMIAPLALLLTIAGVERQSVAIDVDSAHGSEVVGAEPALVRVGAAGRVNDMEDRIAWIDTMISEAPVAGLSAADRAELRSGREALANSLQRVRYAQTLLAY